MTTVSLNLEDSIQFADNKEPRCPCVLVVDTSGSMRGERIHTVNEALRAFEQDVRNDPLKGLRTELAVIGFNHETQTVQDFTGGHHFTAPQLEAYGGTKIAPALDLAMDLCQERKETYRQHGITYYRPLIFLITDGYPEHDHPDDIANVTSRLESEEASRKVAAFCFGINDRGNGRGADIAAMNRIMVRPAVELSTTDQIGGSIEWMSKSLSVMSESQPGEATRLPDMDFLTV